MEFFKGQSSQRQEKVASDEVMTKRAEVEMDILSAELQNKNWVEIWNSLCSSELAEQSIVTQLSVESKEKLKQIVVEANEVFSVDKENVREDLVEPIQKALDKLSEIL